MTVGSRLLTRDSGSKADSSGRRIRRNYSFRYSAMESSFPLMSKSSTAPSHS